MLSHLSLTIRSALPEPVKRLGRGLRLLVTPAPPPAPAIPQAQLDGCRVFASRFLMLDALPARGSVVEVGTQAGAFARAILERCQPAELHLVDVTFARLVPEVRRHPAVCLHAGSSSVVLGRFAADSFDWIYVDADHGYAGVRRDIEVAKNKVRPGGFLVFNDFARIVRPGLGVFGVHQAVSEFAVAEGWPVTHLALDGEALYDVALQRPA